MNLLQEPDRLTIAGDWHGNTNWAVGIINAAQDADVGTIVHTGDFGIWSGRRGQEYLDVLDTVLDDRGTTLLFVDGNHEDFDLLYSLPVDSETGLRQVRPWIHHLPRGFRWTWAGKTWLALGGATSLDKSIRTHGWSWWPQEELTDADCELATSGGRADVMVTHDAPTGSPVPGLDPRMWDPAALRVAYAHQDRLRDVVNVVKPSVIYHSHFHRDYCGLLANADWGCLVRGLDCDSGRGANFLVTTPRLLGT